MSNATSLIDISLPPTRDRAAVLLARQDNVVIARVPLPEGQEIELGGTLIRTRSAVPMGHKIASRAIAAGEAVRRYGEVIGRAHNALEPGEHLHTHNIEYEEQLFDYQYPQDDKPIPS